MSSWPVPARSTLANVYDSAYASVPNWDIGRPQRAFVYLAEAGLIDGPVLEVGCGTGELTLFLARQGFNVLGFDISARAIAQARQKAAWRRIPANFLVGDALRLGWLADRGLRFRTVLDCAMFHILASADRERFVDGLESVLERGGRFYVLGDARWDPLNNYGITPDELRERFESRPGWTVEFAYETIFERRYSTNAAYLVCVRRE